MCTAISFKAKDHYFGRNLELYYKNNETITNTPRKFPLKFRKTEDILTHYAFIGVSTVDNNYPLYYDATNEKGLSMAGLNFPKNAHYPEFQEEKLNIAPFEIIPWVMGKFSSVNEAVEELKSVNLVGINYSEEMPLSPLHFIISDKEKSVTLESTVDGLKIYDNPVGVLTNNPTFDTQMLLLQNYSGLSRENHRESFSDIIESNPYSLGMGAMGLPGDFSSPSRFVKAVFVKLNSLCDDDENSAVGQFFHILSSVEQPKGSVKVEKEKYEYTLYSSCCNTDKGIFYYTTYENRSITAVDMNKEDLNGNSLITYPFLKGEKITLQN